MPERVNVVPAELRQAASDHRVTAEQLSAAPASHAEVLVSLESLGPIFADLRDAGRDLLDQRRACYEQQAAAHAELADKLDHAADVWEQHDADAAGELGAITEGGP